MKHITLTEDVLPAFNENDVNKIYLNNVLLKSSTPEITKVVTELVQDSTSTLIKKLREKILIHEYTLSYSNPKFCYEVEFDGDNEKIIKKTIDYSFNFEHLPTQEGFTSKNIVKGFQNKDDNTIFNKQVNVFRKLIQDQKKKNSSKEIETLTFTSQRYNKNYTYTMCDGVHLNPGAIVELSFAMQAARVFEPKKPKNANKHVGIELEFFCNIQRDQLAGKLHKAKLANYVELKTDGSIKNYPSGNYGHELAILCEETELEDVVNRVTSVLKETNAQVNSSCGMHMHIDMRNRDRALVFNNLVKVQSILYLLNPKSRMKNKFCNTVQTTDYAAVTDRYTGINPTAYSKHKTFEIRIHSGTVNPIKIINWFKIIQKVVEKTELIKKGFEDLGRFIKHFEFDEEVAKYIITRADKHNTHDIDPADKVVDDRV